MLVEDIYGPDGLDTLGLPSNILASSFGKVSKQNAKKEDFKREDVCRSMVTVMAINIG